MPVCTLPGCGRDMNAIPASSTDFLVRLAMGVLFAGSSLAGICEFSVVRDGGIWPAEAGAVAVYPVGVVPELARLEVITTSGVVGSRAVWARTGEPMTVIFDTSGGAEAYTVRLSSDGTSPTPDWMPHAGLLLETRSRAEGPVEKLAQVQQLWQHATNTFGRSRVPNIFDGSHRHGRSADFISRYSGWFQAPVAGRYGFAIIADNASFLLIDGAPVVEWPGWHNVDGARYGQHSGTVELSRGRHQLEFWNVQGTSQFVISLAWQPPNEARFVILPPEAFLPVASFRVAGVRGDQAPAIFSWAVAQHALAGEEAGLFGLRFQALDAGEGKSFHWRFDDHTEQSGSSCLHVFSRSGARRVELTVRQQGHVLGTVQQMVSVHPNWLQGAEFPEQVYAELRSHVSPETLDQMAPADLAGYLRLAEKVEDWGFMKDLAGAVYRRQAVFTNELAATLQSLGFYYQRPGVMQYDRVVAVWRAVLADAAASPELCARTAVCLAAFLVHSGTDVAGGQQLLTECAPDDHLAWADRRFKLIVRADALVLQGQREAAVACYRQAGTAAANNDTNYEVRRRGRIENARDYLRRKEWDAAEQVVRSLEWEWPMERLELETGLLMVEVHRGRNELQLARGVCRRLLAAAPANPRRADLLLVTAQVCRDLKHDRECQVLLQQLWKEHPYSEAAALAKDRFFGVERGGR